MLVMSAGQRGHDLVKMGKRNLCVETGESAEFYGVGRAFRNAEIPRPGQAAWRLCPNFRKRIVAIGQTKLWAVNENAFLFSSLLFFFGLEGEIARRRSRSFEVLRGRCGEFVLGMTDWPRKGGRPI